jgi:hypothetical protein
MTEWQILEKLTRIEEELNFIKNHILDADLLITYDNLESIEEAEEDIKNERTERII